MSGLLPILERWVARTTTGDRAELRDLPEDLPMVGAVGVGRELPRHDVPAVQRFT